MSLSFKNTEIHLQLYCHGFSYLVEVGVDTLVEVGVDTLEDVDTDDDVETELDVDTLKQSESLLLHILKSIFKTLTFFNFIIKSLFK